LGVTEAGIDVRLDLAKQAQMFTTPAKAANLMGSDKLDYEQDRTLSPFLTEDDLTQREMWREDPFVPSSIVDHLEKLGDAMDKVMSDSHQHLVMGVQNHSEVAGDFGKVKAWQDQMDGRVGMSVPIKEREFPSLWGALEYSVRASESELQQLRESLESEKEIMSKDFAEWKKAVVQGFEDVDEFLGKQLDTLAQNQKDLESKLKGTGLRGGPRIQNGVLFARQAYSGEGDSEGGQERDDEVKEDVLLDLRVRLRKLEVSVKGCPGGGGGGDGPPAFGNLGLSTVGDLAAWNLDQGSGFQFGLFVDGPALLTFKRDDFVSVSDQLAGLKRAGDIGLNQTQVRVLASFQNTLPEFFGKGSETCGSSLPAMPKLTDWEAEDGINGAKFRLERSLPLIQKQLSTYIDTFLGEDKLAARELAHRCLSHSMLFVTRLSDYITRTSRALRVAGYKVDKVWAILSRQVLRIFEDMARARVCAVDLAPPMTKRGAKMPEDGIFQDHNAALAMWAVLKTHDVMADYLAHNFEDHPSIAAENVRFLTYNVMGAGGNNTDTDVKNLEKLVDKMDEVNKNLRVQLEKVNDRVDRMETLLEKSFHV
jgi:hypothetical protein